MLIEVFKTGTHKDSNGNEQVYTAEMLDQIVQNYSTQVQEDANNLAPLVKGHPKSNEPALGWVKKICRRGKKLLAKIENVDSNLMDDIKADKYKHFSIALYPSMQLRHVGILGAVPPAVKGLNRNGIVCFYDDKKFNEYTSNAPANDVTQTDITSEIEIQQAEMEELKEYLNSTCHQTVLPTQEVDEDTNNLADTLVNKLQETNTELVKQIKGLEKQVRLHEYSDYVNSVVLSGNFAWTPAQKSALVDILELAYSQGAQTNCACNNFAEGTNGDKATSQRLGGKIKSFVESLNANKQPANAKNQTDLLSELELNNGDIAQFGNNIPFADIENSEVKTDRIRHKMHLEAIAHMKQHPTATYSDAIEHLVNSKW